MDTPRLSICIPLYNKAPHLEHCLGTILNQAVTGMEISIFDNGSTDGSSEIAQRMAASDSHIRYTRLEHTVMVQESWRMAFLHGRGELLKLHSADDELHPDFLAAMLLPLEDPAVEFTLCAEELQAEGVEINQPTYVFYERINETCRKIIGMSDPVLRARELIAFCAGANLLGNIYKVVVRRNCLPRERWKAVTSAYPLPTAYPDWDFLIRLLLNHRGRFVEQRLSRYRVLPDSPFIRRQDNPEMQIADAFQLLLMILTVMGDPHLSRLRDTLKPQEFQQIYQEAVRRAANLANQAAAFKPG